MKKIKTLFLGFLIISCGAVEDDMDETVNTPEPTPVTFGEWTPAFSDQREDFTQTRTGSDGSNQTRTITVSSSIVGTEDVYEMEDNQDYNNDGDMFDIAEIVQTRYLTSPNVGSIEFDDIQVEHNNNGTNQIEFNGSTYPVNSLTITKEPYDREYILDFDFFTPDYVYKPTPSNTFWLFLTSDMADELSFGKYDTRYNESEINSIQEVYNFNQSTDDKFITALDAASFYPNTLVYEHFAGNYSGQGQGKKSICYQGIPADSFDCEFSDNTNNVDGILYTFKNVQLHYKEFNENYFLSVKGVDYNDRSFSVFYYSPNHNYVELSRDDSCVGEIVSEYTINNEIMPLYKTFKPYTGVIYGLTEDCNYHPWFEINPNLSQGLFTYRYNDLSENQIYPLVSQNILVQRLYTMQLTGEWIDFYQNTFGYVPAQVNVAKIKLESLTSPENPTVEIYYKQDGTVEFLRVGINDSSTPSGFHMYRSEYDYTQYLNQTIRDEIQESSGENPSYNNVELTIQFYLDRYLKDLRNDAIVRFD